MSSAVARPIRSSSKKLTSSTWFLLSLRTEDLGLSGVLSGGCRAGTPCWTASRPHLSDLFDAARLAPGQVDAELLRGAEDVLLGLSHLDGLPVAGQDLDVEAEALHLLDEHLEGLGDAGLGDVVALDDGLVHLHATVGLEGPDLHLTEALAAELGLTAERLLGDHRVRAGAARVDLVVHEVVQLEDVHVAHGHRFRERLARAAVEEHGLPGAVDEPDAVPGRAGAVEEADDLVLPHAVEDGRGDAGAGRGVPGILRDQPGPVRVARDLPASAGGPAEVELEDLPDVHPARDTERVEHDVDRGAVLEERHVLDGQDLGDDPLDADDRAGLAVGNLEGGVTDLARLLTEDRAEQALLGGELGLALRRHLADEEVAVADLRPDPDDAALVEVGENLVRDVRDVPGDLLGAELA